MSREYVDLCLDLARINQSAIVIDLNDPILTIWVNGEWMINYSYADNAIVRSSSRRIIIDIPHPICVSPVIREWIITTIQRLSHE